ncbi:alpha/beta fold hydrolase [Streptomyces sp. NPDC056704]|uniref:alpha/beta fold hydrolase n=1 Tax=Streptomyces sp. NPDC056704 TaxID=3345917 RepID=UPI0036A01882
MLDSTSTSASWWATVGAACSPGYSRPTTRSGPRRRSVRGLGPAQHPHRPQGRARRLNTIRNVPVLILAGEEDSQFPVHVVRKMADAIEGSTFRVLQHTAHLAARENPEGVNAEIDAFLAALPAAA